MEPTVIKAKKNVVWFPAMILLFSVDIGGLSEEGNGFCSLSANFLFGYTVDVRPREDL